MIILNEIILDALYALIDEIKSSELYIKYKNLEKIILSKYPNEINSFNNLKEKYQNALEYGKYYPGLDEIKNEFLDAKNDLYLKEEMLEYKKCELEIELKLKEISLKLSKTIME